jgi:peptidoglycan/LPS O-acetylase OafA/YrhL
VSVSPALAPPPGNPRFAGVDALRGVAILLVLVCHTTQISGAASGDGGWLLYWTYVGVVLFFGISGFLLYRPYVAAHAGGHATAPVGRYLRRRALRILPAYWVALVLLSLWPGTQGMWEHWWQNLLLLQIYGPGTTGDGLGIAWSLCVEASFYLVLPLLAVVARGLGRRRGWWQGALAMVVPFGVAGIVVANLTVHELPTWLGSTLAGLSSWFAAGMLLAVLSVAAERPGPSRAVAAWTARRAPLVWVAAVGTWLLSAWVLSGIGHRPPFVLYVAQLVGLPLACTLLLAPVVLGARGAVGRVVARRPLTLLGLVSYGVFLWHYQLAWWLNGGAPWQDGSGPHLAGRVDHLTLVLTAATLAGSIAIATVSYRVVELPFLRRKEPRPRG